MGGILIYLFPAVMDMILAVVFFMTTTWAAQQGVNPSGVSNLITTWSAVYMVCALGIGRIVTKRNAAWMIIGSCLATAGLSALFAVVQDLRAMYALVALEGVTMAVFFTPFQVFMKLIGERKRRSIPWSVGLYTCSWSSGYAIGPFVAGLLWKPLGWTGCHLLCGGIALAVAVATYWIYRHLHGTPAGDAGNMDTALPAVAYEGSTGPSGSSVPELVDYSDKPDLAWMSWLFGGIGCIAISVIRGVFPSSGTACGLSEATLGQVFALLSAIQALVGLALALGKRWMYRPLPILGFGFCGLAGLVLFGLAKTPAGFFLAAACFGMYSGSFFFYFVFHSLVHPEHAGRYVSINEAVVGLAGIAGPLVGGLLAANLSLTTPFLLSAGMILAAIGVQSGIHARKERRGQRV